MKQKSRAVLLTTKATYQDNPSKNSRDQALYRDLKALVRRLFGQYGLAVVSWYVNVEFISPTTHLAIIRGSVPAITLLSQALQASQDYHLITVAGSMKKVQKEAIRHHRSVLKDVREGREREKWEAEREILEKGHGGGVGGEDEGSDLDVDEVLRGDW